MVEEFLGRKEDGEGKVPGIHYSKKEASTSNGRPAACSSKNAIASHCTFHIKVFFVKRSQANIVAVLGVLFSVVTADKTG